MSSNKDVNNQPGSISGGKKRRPPATLLWVIIVFLIGVIFGTGLYLLGPGVFYPRFPGGPPPPGSSGPGSYLQYHIILSTISVALLLALLFVYGKIYAKTRASFILGLIVVLFTLLLQNLLGYPFVHPFVDDTPFESVGASSPVSDVLAIIAYSVFLYLSIE